MRHRGFFPILIVLASLIPDAPPQAAETDLPAPKKVIKSDRDWAKQLTQLQFMVTRRKATEPPYSGKLARNHAVGSYDCICCDQVLFTSRAKFESGTGWPSFWSPVAADRIQTAPDYHGTEPRIEVTCSRCDAHLGHVFEDGPAPTGLRFCMNSAALKFVPEVKAKAKAKPTTKPAPTPTPEDPPTPTPTPTPDSSAPAPAP